MSSTEGLDISKCPVMGNADGEPRFVNDFVQALTKVMNADRFDLQA